MSKTSKALAGAERAYVVEFLEWVSQFEGVEAFPVYDYMALEVPDTDGHDAVPGVLNGITIQWDVHDVLIEETEEGEPNVVHPTAAGAVHVRVGGVVTVSGSGFVVENPPIVVDVAEGVA